MLTLAAVCLGFLLSQFATTWRDIWKGRKAKRLISEELSSNLAILPQKREIIGQIIRELSRKKILPGESVPFMTTSYDLNLHLAYEYLKPLQRDSLHVIYERAKQSDAYLSRFESELLKHLDLKLIPNPYAMFVVRMREILETYRVIEDLSTKYISDMPVDVFRRESRHQ